jgi:acyl-CoA synthetase (AMP-forming)/AMP-acid ligase II
MGRKIEMSATGLRWLDGDRLDAQVRAGLLGDGAPFEMRLEDVAGVRLPVFVRRPKRLMELLAGSAERLGDRRYLVFPERTYTFEDFVGPVARAAQVLQENYDIARGDRVAIASANCADYAIAFWALTALGAITVALNGWWTGPELAYGIELTRPKVIFGDERRLQRMEEIQTRFDAPVVAFGEDWWDEGNADVLPRVEMSEDDPCLVQFTSGTTGRPKGALLSHRGIIHFVWSSLLCGAANQSLYPAAPDSDPPCVLSASPMFHISGMQAQVVLAAATAMTIVYPAPGRWDEDVHLSLTEQHRVTNWSLVPTQLWRLLDHPDLHRYDLSSVRRIGGGSSVWPPELLRSLHKHLPQVGVSARFGYGMTETNGLGTLLQAPFTESCPDSVGEPSPAVEVEVRDPESGESLPEGVVGEVCLRTASVFLSYWDNPEETSQSMWPDRWYRTRDLGHVRDGVLYLDGRRDDMIIRGGENVYPLEVEIRLTEHPAITEAAVVGVEHPILGKEVKAFVVLAAHQTLEPEDIRAWTATSLAAFKVPAQIEIVDALPRNAMGKVLKHMLVKSERATPFIEE